jgi:hypothetical protein
MFVPNYHHHYCLIFRKVEERVKRASGAGRRHTTVGQELVREALTKADCSCPSLPCCGASILPVRGTIAEWLNRFLAS